MTVMTEIRKRNTTESVLKAFAKSKAVKTLVKSFAQSSLDILNQPGDNMHNNMHMHLARDIHGYGKNSVLMIITQSDYFRESKIKFIFQYNLFGMKLANVSYTGTISKEMMDEAATFVKGQLW